ncbi:synaptopodin 2-like protein [Syngnathoides biaculeatus]|uniref:synaptopodin 2-like protein n=1 Tax=Syngnathoides biaculeatus TaxID=300417 RepID=UPI002ADE062D|nr:synaptopodin 2-like protein [Syngnathoides biaculeatus]
MVAEEVLITLSGGAPWGFRLQGGAEHHKPLQVAKVRKRSKACRAGLREADELMSINDRPCDALSHAQAMNLIDASPGTLHIRVKRVPAGFQSVVLVTRAPSPRIDKEYRASLQNPSATDVHQAPLREVHRGRSSRARGLTSPPGSEAYYGETDSDADVAAYERQRRQKRRSPNSNPGKQTGWTSPGGGETSEMSGYDSAPDANAYLNSSEGFGGGENGGLPGVARREVIYQPTGPGMWSSHTSTETSSNISSADDQGPRDGDREEDFLELANVPLVSPERAKEALMLGSRSQLVPMVGPVNNPIDEELTTTYMEKAKQAKLHRGDTPQDKHVKEARSKCKTIASLLTAAPNPHSKGVLMFKKRRQRSKKYTLTSFGSVDEDQRRDSQEEDGPLLGSESEFEEEGFSSAPDPTWDSDYLNMLEKRATAGVEGRGDREEDAPSPGLNATAGKGAQLFEQQRKRAAEHAKKVEETQSQVVERGQMFYPDMRQDMYQAQATFSVSNGEASQATGGTRTVVTQGGPRSAISSVDMIIGSPPPGETPIPEAPADRGFSSTRAYGITSAAARDASYTTEGNNAAVSTGKMPPPVAPKPRVLHEAPEIIQAGGKGAQLFARRQNRMGMYLVDAPPQTHHQQEVSLHGAVQPPDHSSSQWKYSSNVRAPPPIGYNPLLGPSIPTGPQRNMGKPSSKGKGAPQREGIQALDFMRRQPYQLNSAMFNYSMAGSSLMSPKQIPVKTVRTYEIKRFSTPTPMSAPTLVPKVLAPRSATTLGERINHSDMTTPPPATHYSPASYNTGLRGAKQFQSAPELSILSSLPPLKANPVQAPKPRFVATKGGVLPGVWRPAAI